MSVCTREFLSHPIDQPKHSLIEHLIAVGEKSKELFAETSFKNQKIAFYSGLLHDVGKINPWYQEIFNAIQEDRKKTQEEVSEKFVQQHSVFSAWITKYLLSKIGLEYDVIDKILVLIYGHHSTIRRSLGEIKHGPQFKASQEIMKESIKDFSSQVSDVLEFSKLNWNSCVERFPRPVLFDLKLNSCNTPDDYLEMSMAFSCLLQADRGSFKDWLVPKFSLSLDTAPLAKPKQMRDLSSFARIQQEKMGAMRNRFQEEVMENFDYSEKVIVIHAPTGIGKTKVFLDLISKYKDDKTIQRVFYFSPLLALTEDFESKFESTLEDKKQASDVLIYNHMFAESLEEKRKDSDDGYNREWNFLIESFNKQFVITTTQRFLMTLYSNTTKEKLKMASFRNSILIIDEVQTIPKFILSNLKDIFQKMGQCMGTKIILVSATIPNEINEISKVKISKDLLDDYLDQTQKLIAIETLDLPTLIINKTLVMANTRKKAVNLYNSIAQIHKERTKIYLSSGIRKKDRINILKNLSAKENYVLVSTQVVEAGVDLSFSNIYREAAPLDNIIQVMGRLNREGLEPDAKLVVYPTDGNELPYSKLEFDESWKILQNIHNSKEIYAILEQYYGEISARNKRNIEKTVELETHVQNLDFEKVWTFVKNELFAEDDRDSVFVPELENWDELRDTLVNNQLKDNFKEYGLLTATLPHSVDKIGREYFDEELLEKNILLPKKEYLKTIYDENTGLDKWIIQETVSD
ncbi:MAG: CRISPR-associated helicase Cas3' [Candidatus Nitrosopelagicus sp.]|nr:CRISPR-associated helicase Cas3' [Candidatus Nitrosopelagicus sp.]